MDFETFFKQATGFAPMGWQARLASGENADVAKPETLRAGREAASLLIDIPTGCGKTAGVVLSWLWNRIALQNPEWPRRFVYCLPMRVLVEQTRDEVSKWLANLLQHAESLGLPDRAREDLRWLVERSPVVLMGGEELDEARREWDVYPEKPCVLIGTQDMLLSRALNRGYGMSRYRWPMHFGLLNNDCLWICDEVQLMGSGLKTSVQLEAFRNKLGAYSPMVHTFWISATLKSEWLETVDFKPKALMPPVQLLPREVEVDENLRARHQAIKPLDSSKAVMGEMAELAKEIAGAHSQGHRTLVIVNTVDRAQELYRAVKKQKPAASVLLLHSRYRPADRKVHMGRLLAEPGPEGLITISTQVVEAGVDVSAKVLFTEVAPWSSLVQRFGRCNRKGEYGKGSGCAVFWIGLPKEEKAREKIASPYELEELTETEEQLKPCRDKGVGPAALPEVRMEMKPMPVIRLKDFVDLFDTTPDLAGNDIDIDRYIRDAEDTDVQVFWRTFDKFPGTGEPLPAHGEICRVAVGKFRDFAKGRDVYRRNFLEGKWEKASSFYPGQTYLLNAEEGGYTDELGWVGKDSKPAVNPLPHPSMKHQEDDGTDADPWSETDWQTLQEHSEAIVSEMHGILKILPHDDGKVLETAARWHDLGKIHSVFQNAIKEEGKDGAVRREDMKGNRTLAKAPKDFWKRYSRRHFRHELASALAVLHPDVNGLLPSDQRDLIAYLVASHHGKVRLSIRSLPGEKPAGNGKRFARGVWDGDILPSTDLGGGVRTPSVTLSLEPMELGLCEEEPFKDQPSWLERMLALRDDPALGPLRLAFMEALLRAADARASQLPGEKS